MEDETVGHETLPDAVRLQEKKEKQKKKKQRQLVGIYVGPKSPVENVRKNTTVLIMCS